MTQENNPAWNIRSLFFILTGILIHFSVSAQLYSEAQSAPVIIRSGLKGTIGYSRLYLDDRIRPDITASEYYSFTPDLCAKAGAIITVQPRFFGDRFQLVFDPAFTKFSYGNLKEEKHGDFVTSADIDVEALEIPISLRYSFLRGMHKILPYIRGGYSFSYFVDTEAQFRTEDMSGDELIKYETFGFNYSKFQDALFLCPGFEVDFSLFDVVLELVLEKGDGIYKEKFGDSFLKLSHTTSAYLQLGVLF